MCFTLLNSPFGVQGGGGEEGDGGGGGGGGGDSAREGGGEQGNKSGGKDVPSQINFTPLFCRLPSLCKC